ncbi:MAG: cytochrome d ubiquinol oxidase subunit II [Firmicutes bacterium]|nr:cytochrome d ubiquinol oxidase subunit II [Bacillota bacterium]
MELNALWFILLTVLFIGYFFLEGFDYGVGTLARWLGRDDTERRVLVNTIGPVWDGNEVWLLTAGGAMFAAFPNLYATLFSGLYLALLLMLVALIVRGVAFEFRSRDDRPGWRNLWDWMLFVGSVVPALLWGVAMANLARGVPVDAKMQYAGTFWNLLSPYALLGGIVAVTVFLTHGVGFVGLKAEGALVERARRAGLWAGAVAWVALLLLVIFSYGQTGIMAKPAAAAALWATVLAFLAAYGLLWARRYGWAFVLNGVSIALGTAGLFLGLFPNLLVSRLNPDWSLTIYNASSSPYTLKVMTIVALTLVPIVLAYQAWTYWVFRQRVTSKSLHY